VVARRSLMARRRPAASSLEELLDPLIAREIAGIAAIDAAIARERRPDYVVLLRAAKSGKQANVEQMATAIRIAGGVSTERGGVRKPLLRMQSAVARRAGGTTAALQAMRLAEHELLAAYRETIDHVEGHAERALHKALGRTLVHWHLLTAHLAQRTGDRREARRLPLPLDRYFAGTVAKACMRCHLDRPGALPALERRDPHPYTYLCAACHQDVRRELPPDLAAQMERWPRSVREARILEHGLGRPSVLHAIHAVLRPLAGLAPDRPLPAADRKHPATPLPPPAPAPGEGEADLVVDPATAAEAEYVAAIFDYRSPRASW
jgi:hypothetical protein